MLLQAGGQKPQKDGQKPLDQKGRQQTQQADDQEHRPSSLGEAVLAPDHQGMEGANHQQRRGSHDNAFQVQFHGHHLVDIIP